MSGTLQNWTGNVSESNSSAPNERVFSSNFVFLWAVVYCVLVACGILLNLLVVYVMLRSRKIRTSISSFLIFHLSLTHLIFHIAVPWLTLTLYRASLLACRFSVFIEFSCAAAIFSSLAAIAWDRQRNIIQPFKSLVPRRWKTYLLLITGIWLYAFAASTSFIYSARLQSVKICWRDRNGTKACENYPLCHTPMDWKTQLSKTLYFLMAFFVPFLYILGTYTEIAVRLWKRSKSGNIHGAVAKNKARTIRLMVIAVLVFALCWGTNFGLELLRVYGVLDNLSDESDIMLQILSYLVQALSSCLNPAVYAFFSPEFRKNCFKFCCCCFNRCLYFRRGRRYYKSRVQPITLNLVHTN